MSPVGFGPTISAGERPQTCALDRATCIIVTIYNSKKVITQNVTGGSDV